MPYKKDILATITKQTYNQSEVRYLITSVKSEKVRPPTRLKKGDVVVVASGIKTRPAVIIKVLKETVVVIPLSSTEDSLNLLPFNSRFFGENYFSKYLMTVTKDYATEHFVGVFDCNRDLNKAIKLIKEYVKQL